MRNSKWAVIAILPLLFFLAIFFYWPLFRIIQITIQAGYNGWKQTFSSRLFPRFFIFTIIQSILTVIGSLLVGLPAGYLLARTKPYARQFLRAAITVPFLFPPLVILIGFVVLFEPSGLLGQLIPSWHFTPFSFWGIILAHTLYNISIVARISEGAFSSEPEDYHILADTLGASWWMKFRSITLPHIKPALESAVLLVFLYAFNSFAIVLILGEVRLQTIEVMIYNQSRIRFNIQGAAILAVFQLLVNMVIIFLYTTRRTYQTGDDSGQRVSRSESSLLPTIILGIIILLTWSPVLMVFRYSILGLLAAPDQFTSQLFSGQFDRYLGTSSTRVLLNTLFFGLTVSSIAVILSTLSVLSSYLTRSQLVEKLSIPLTLLPMGTSAITISFAILQTHGQFTFFSDIVFIYIIAAQLIAALPFASRALFSSWQRVPKDLILVSQTLGENSLSTFRKVVLPYLKSGLFIAFLFSFAISIGEFGATYYLVRNQWTTLSLAINKLFASRTALLPNLYASILVLFSLLVFWIIERFGSLELRL